MNQGQDVVEAVSFLTSATARLRLLSHLATGSATQADLQAALDLPQSTLARNLGKLRDRGWVVEVTAEDIAPEDDRRSRYRLTALGAATVRDLEPVADRTSVLDRLTAEPDAFPLETFDFDVGRLAGATWRTSSETEPYAVANRVRTVLEGSTSIRGVRPHPNPAYSDVLARVAAAPDREVMSVVPEDRLGGAAAESEGDGTDASGDREHAVGEGASAGTDGVDAPAHRHAVDEAVDFATIVVDGERVLLTGGHRGGMPSVLVETTDRAVLEWARARVEGFLAAATPVGGVDQ